MITLNQYIEKNYKVGFKTNDIKNFEEANFFILAEPKHNNPKIIKINSEFINKFSKKGDSILLEGFAKKQLTKKEYSLNSQVMDIEKCIEEKGLLMKGWDKDSIPNLLKLDEKEQKEYKKIQKLQISLIRTLQQENFNISNLIKMTEQTSLSQASTSLQQKTMEFSTNVKFITSERTTSLNNALSSEKLNKNRVFVIAGSAHVLTIKQIFTLMGNSEQNSFFDESDLSSIMIKKMQQDFLGRKEVKSMQKNLRKALILFPKIIF